MAKVWTLCKCNVNNMGPVKTFITIICSLLSIFTTVEQSIVIYVIANEKVLRESSHSYILSLSLTGRWNDENKKPNVTSNEGDKSFLNVMNIRWNNWWWVLLLCTLCRFMLDFCYSCNSMWQCKKLILIYLWLHLILKIGYWVLLWKQVVQTIIKL